MTSAAHHFNNDLRYREADHPGQTQFTPRYVLALVAEDLGGHIWLDPCTTPDNPTQADRFFTAEENGLAQSWIGGDSIFVNPPYGKSHLSALIGWNTELDACTRLGVRLSSRVPQFGCRP